MVDEIEVSEHARELSVDQLRVIPYLLQGMRPKEAAVAAGIAYSTLTRWLSHDERFRAEYERQRLQIYESDLQYARARVREQLESDDPKTVINAGRVLIDADVGYRRAHATVTHTVVLEKLAAMAASSADAEAVDAEYRALAESAEGVEDGGIVGEAD